MKYTIQSTDSLYPPRWYFLVRAKTRLEHVDLIVVFGDADSTGESRRHSARAPGHVFPQRCVPRLVDHRDQVDPAELCGRSEAV